VVIENYSSTDMALAWSHGSGEAYNLVPACWLTGGFVVRQVPWVLNVGLAPRNDQPELVGEPLAKFDSGEMIQGAPAIVRILIPAAGEPVVDQLVDLPDIELGRAC
jgi:hypothetical protein